jgi:hypothetical protein
MNDFIQKIFKNLPSKGSPISDGFTDEFYYTFKQESMSTLKLIQNTKKRDSISKAIYQGHH